MGLFLTAPAKVKVQTSWFHLSGFVYSTIMWAVADHLSDVEPSCTEQISLEPGLLNYKLFVM